MSFPSSFYQHLQKHTLTGIKGGRQRPSFLDIWMVTVEGRVFARSWNKSARSWFTAFQETGEGEIKYGDRVICVRGRQPEDDPQLTAQINQAYLRKYTQPENIPYAEGITKPEYAAYTMEFFYVDDQKAGNIPEEGYIKFRADWTATPPLPWESLEELDHWRNVMYEAGLIGAYPDGIGFGNISKRWNNSDQFIISGSATGNHRRLNATHYALVTSVDIDQNCLQCSGPILASSESMSHAVIYRECPEVQAVIHVHDLKMWEDLLHQVPTTDASATYGSPEMAYSIIDLLQNTDLRTRRLFVMEGHREGIFAFGDNLETAAEVITTARSTR